jgi:hypothetical protein
MRRHLSYANVAATLALVFSMSGGALAAKHYLVNSTEQINPKVLTALRGNEGATGPAGVQGKEGPAGKGAEGPAGPRGEEGSAGPQGEEGPAGPQGEQGPAGSLGTTGNEGPTGEEGPTGREGPTGKEGAPGATNVVTRYGPKIALPTGSAGVSYAVCLQGEAVTGGGFDLLETPPVSSNYLVKVNRASIVEEPTAHTRFFPAPQNGHAATGWAAGIANNTGSTLNFRAYVQCASP